MAERKYSVSEIDSMRRSIDFIAIPPGQPFYEKDKLALVDSQLGSYMLAGVEPQDVIDECKKTIAAWQEIALRSERL